MQSEYAIEGTRVVNWTYRPKKYGVIARRISPTYVIVYYDHTQDTEMVSIVNLHLADQSGVAQ